MDQYRFAGYRVIEFPQASKVAMKEIAERLIPHESAILERWIGMQFRAWQPPGLNKEQLTQLFGGILANILRCMKSGELEACISDLEESGAGLARSNFPFEALIVSIHFLEESYMPFMLNPRSERVQEWLIRMDEFLHVGLAALATSYFQFHRDQLLADAEVGRIVQEALFPHPPKRLGDLELGFIYASATERTRIGGDFLDVFRFGDDGAAFVVGDLSGHGLEAAASSATIRNLYKGFTRDMVSLSEAMGKLNRALVDELADTQFATALAGMYESDGTLTLVNAGSPLPVIVCSDGCSLHYQVGLPLGIDSDASFEQMKIKLLPGDVFVSYTDGVSEARVANDLFGDDRILSAVNEMRDAPARAIAEHLKDKAIHHAQGKLMDDMAILVIKRAVA